MAEITLRKGDHLRVDTSWGPWIEHHGICVGGTDVIHFKRDREVKNVFDFFFSHVLIDKTPIEAFHEGREVVIVRHDPAFCYPPDEVVETAEYLLWLQTEGLQSEKKAQRGGDKQREEQFKEIKYKFLGFNCEHFANLCKTGCKESPQVDNAKEKANYAAIISTPFLPSLLKFLSFDTSTSDLGSDYLDP